DASNIAPLPAHGRIACCGEDRGGQEKRDGGLNLQEQEETPAPALAPFLLKFRVARILAALQRALQDLQTETTRPERGHRCHEKPSRPITLPAQNRNKRGSHTRPAHEKGPDGIDPAGSRP